MAVYAVGGRRGIILIPEGRKGRGWSHFAAELGKVIAFFEDSAGSGIVPPPLVLKGSGNLVEPGLVQSHFLTGFVDKKFLLRRYYVQRSAPLRRKRRWERTTPLWWRSRRVRTAVLAST